MRVTIMVTQRELVFNNKIIQYGCIYGILLLNAIYMILKKIDINKKNINVLYYNIIDV
jgi:hypothetical protein